MAGAFAIQFILTFFFMPETAYVRHGAINIDTTTTDVSFPSLECRRHLTSCQSWPWRSRPFKRGGTQPLPRVRRMKTLWLKPSPAPHHPNLLSQKCPGPRSSDPTVDTSTMSRSGTRSSAHSACWLLQSSSGLPFSLPLVYLGSSASQ
jgi:hypothetical protein